MAICKWCDKKMKNMRWFDISLIKISVFFFAWFITAFFVTGPSWFTSLWWVWLIIWVILGIIPAIRFFVKKRKK